MNLSTNQKTTLDNLNKGYEGEWKFYKLLEKELTADSLALYGLQFEVNNSEFQIDCLLIVQNSIFLFEVKNYEGDFYIEGGRWYAEPSGNEVRDPLHQINRSEILFRRLLQQLGYNLTVKSYIVFVNSEFHLYQAPINQSIIFPGQLMRFIKTLNNMTGSVTKRHTRLADQLALRHIHNSSHERLPKYTYEELKKGIVCRVCANFLSHSNMMTLRCDKCGSEEDMESVIMRSVREFNLLFPERRITTSAIFEWCKIYSKKTIRRILKKTMKFIKNSRYSHFIFK